MFTENKDVIEKRVRFKLPYYTLGEEIANAVTHGLGVIFSIVAIIFLIMKYSNNFFNTMCFLIYGGALLVLYAVSTLYHSLNLGFAKSIFRKLDHCSIFLLIAGTYTPICALYIKNLSAWIVLIAVWITAILGMILNAIDVNKFSKFSLVCYIIMGWSVIFIIGAVRESLNSLQINFLLWGGIIYTIGAVLYVVGKKIKYIHSIWHLFVLAGSILHFFVVY